MAEQFCLRWNNHQSTIVSVFETLLESETLTDCTLAAEGQYLKAHKVVLSACSPYFEALLCQHYDKHPIVILKDVKFYEMKAMLDYMYKGEVNISQDQLDAFIKTAESLQIKGLTDQGGGGDDDRDVGSTKRKQSSKSAITDIAPESPLVGNAPLREGSISPSLKRRRRGRGSSSAGEDAHVDSSNSCDMPAAAAVTPSAAPPPLPVTPADSARLIVKKTEPPDIIQPKTEVLDDHNDDIEDLTLDDDDEDYGTDMAKPGTSSYNSQGAPPNTDYSQWQMGSERPTDEVFMAAQEAINSQANSQEFLKVVKEEPADWLEQFYSVLDNVFECNFCSYRTSNFSHLKRHICDCHNLKSVFYQCEHCDYVAKQKFHLSRHLIHKHNPNPVMYKCEECDFQSKRKDKLKQHFNMKHDPNPRTYQCPHCDLKTKTKGNLTRHIAILHPETYLIFHPETHLSM